MIVFDLKCEHDHQFEAWFRSSSAYEAQQADGKVECPYCGSKTVVKAPMAPNVAAKSNQKTERPVPRPEPAESKDVAVSAEQDKKLPELSAEAKEVLNKMRQHVEANCDYVGKEFAEEARKMHYGETEERGIYGESTVEETTALLEEGIHVLPVPGIRRTDA